MCRCGVQMIDSAFLQFTVGKVLQRSASVHLLFAFEYVIQVQPHKLLNAVRCTCSRHSTLTVRNGDIAQRIDAWLQTLYIPRRLWCMMYHTGSRKPLQYVFGHWNQCPRTDSSSSLSKAVLLRSCPLPGAHVAGARAG